ncbi:tetratricopeptide repeat protein [Lentzea sp. NEAU-D7]|uniref:tetratricopeptide repeat protein n=1 Tax=Lentzea sp. NEAU-D7 TaxID=2994667 RepID=UPI00224AF546|nr:tetratricopeptide repeat protein [Lentzea sp. NEAU-D7]MCX2954751.1 tetratricopeptide repeat protein [Lentzea sp. NEAU-D7]
MRSPRCATRCRTRTGPSPSTTTRSTGTTAPATTCSASPTDPRRPVRWSSSAAAERGDRWGQGYALYRHGDLYRAMRRYPEAVEHYRQGLDIRREIGDLHGQAVTLVGLGKAMASRGDVRGAQESWTEAEQSWRSWATRSLTTSAPCSPESGTAMRPEVPRLNDTDEALHRAVADFGSGRIVQVLWLFPSLVDSSALHAEWNRLNRGHLSRRAVRPFVPGARRRWADVDNAEPLHEHQGPLPDSAADWVDAQVRAPLPESSLWRLAAAPHRTGTIVSLTVPHFRSDGLGIFRALDSWHVRPRPALFTTITADFRDALAQIKTAVGHLTKANFRRRLKASQCNASTPVAASPARFFSWTIVDVDATSWHDVASANGGTPNTLFTEIAANLIRARTSSTTGIRLGMPRSVRRPDLDLRANALDFATLDLPAGPPVHGDLTSTRRATKRALQLTADRSDPPWHLLPHRRQRGGDRREPSRTTSSPPTSARCRRPRPTSPDNEPRESLCGR